MTSQTIDVKEPSKLSTLRRHKRFEHYYRLALSVLIINAIFLYLQLDWSQSWFENAVMINLTIAILMRQQYVINFLFKAATISKTTLPLWVRWRLGKVYHFGGIHVGAAMSATIFLFMYCWLTITSAHSVAEITLEQVVSTVILLCLLIMIGFSAPQVRSKYHNGFEKVHRFLGWTVLGLFIFVEFLNHSQQQGMWFSNVNSWLLILITFSIVLPWLRLKKVNVTVEKPSNHAVIAHFDYGMTPFPGSSMAISLSPLMEWHSFATICSPDKSGYRLAISRAGDWTGDFINNPPKKVWVKGIATAGVANIEVLFEKVVYVATGSGIGPVLPHLLAKQVPMHLVWTTKNPRKTYGDEVVNEILQAQPNAQVIDTGVSGKPDMLNLALSAYKEQGAEAVIVISNQKLTQQVVQGLESRGIPAFGAIWDS